MNWIGLNKRQRCPGLCVMFCRRKRTRVFGTDPSSFLYLQPFPPQSWLMWLVTTMETMMELFNKWLSACDLSFFPRHIKRLSRRFSARAHWERLCSWKSRSRRMIDWLSVVLVSGQWLVHTEAVDAEAAKIQGREQIENKARTDRLNEFTNFTRNWARASACVCVNIYFIFIGLQTSTFSHVLFFVLWGESGSQKL